MRIGAPDETVLIQPRVWSHPLAELACASVWLIANVHLLFAKKGAF
jgi:hypothetical protein